MKNSLELTFLTQNYTMQCHARVLPGVEYNRNSRVFYHQRSTKRDVCVCASGNRKKKKQKSSLNKSSLEVPVQEILPLSKEEAIEQGSRGLISCLKSLKAPKGMMNDSQEQLWLQVDLPVMGTDVVEDSLGLARELIEQGSKQSAIYIVPDATRTEKGDVVTYSAMMSPDALYADYCFFIAPRKTDVGIVQSIVSSIPQDKAVVLINPEWSPSLGDADGGVNLQYTDFVQSFATAYCFFPILIKPFMMKQIEGVVYSNSALVSKQQGSSTTNKPWKIFMQNDAAYQLVGQMNTRPSSVDVESILYNAIAVNNSTSGKENPLKKLFGGGS